MLPSVFGFWKDCRESGANDDAEDEEEFDWQVEQEVYVERSEEELSGLQKYGFGNKRSGVFGRLQVRQAKNALAQIKADSWY